MGRRVLRCHIWGYSVCICAIKRTLCLNGLKSFVFVTSCKCFLLKIKSKLHVLVIYKDVAIMAIVSTMLNTEIQDPGQWQITRIRAD